MESGWPGLINERIVSKSTVKTPGNRYEEDEDFKSNYTIHSHLLDYAPGKPYQINYYEPMQFFFFEVSCKSIPEKHRTAKTNFFQLKVDGEMKCMLFASGDRCSTPDGYDDSICSSDYIGQE